MSLKIRNVVIHKLTNAWMLSWEERKDKWDWFSCLLYEIRTEEEAKNATVEKFNGLVSLEDITVKE